MNFLHASVYFTVMVSLGTYLFGVFLSRKLKSPLINPLLISVVLTIIVLAITKVSFQEFKEHTQVFSFFLTPATICLAVPLYEQLTLLKKQWQAVFFGILAGVIVSVGSIFLLSKVFSLDPAAFASLLPKSVTNAIAMDLSAEMGGYPSVTASAVMFTGMMGNIFGPLLCKLFRIVHPVAVGVSMGTCSHAIGTARAMELGDIEGAMSSLSIAVAGLITVVFASFAVSLY
ncbi:MAG: LrgB family protein [Clostridia bacterium]|nr:LrgB family protein [Clostridia bacterium]